MIKIKGSNWYGNPFGGISVLLLVLIMLASCGARKVHRSDVSVKEEVNKDSVVSKIGITEVNVKKELLTIENSNDCTISEILEISPVDNEKPAYFNNDGKIENITNAYFKKTRIIKTSSKSKGVDSISEFKLNKKDSLGAKVISSSTLDKKVSDDKIDRESESWLWLLWLLIPIALYLIYSYYKEKIWWI